MRVSDELRVLITDLAPTGDGLVHVEDRAVHVQGALPGDEVRARVTHLARQSNAAYARLESILTPAPSRRRAPCDMDATNRGACTGCPLSVVTEDAQRAMKRALVEGLLGRSVDDFVSGAPLAYRASSKRIVFGKAGEVKLGSYVRGSHRTADMRGCLVDHPAISRAADAIAVHASALGVVPFDPKTGEGTLRYVWLKTNGEEVLVTLVGRVHEEPSIAALAEALDVAGVALAENVSAGNALRGERVTVIRGVAALMLDGTPVGPLGFLQPNPEVARRAYASLVTDAAGAAHGGALALDLYAGLGLTTRALRERFGEVIPCERFEESARLLGVAPESVEDFLAPAVADPGSRLRKATLVVANPPRGGLGEEVSRALAALGYPALTIMSCSPESLARDLRVLLAPAGPYALSRIEAYDTLPQTAHVELVVKLVRGEA